MAGRRKKGKVVLGDKILALYHLLGSCLGTGFLIVLSVGGFGAAFLPDVQKFIRQAFPGVDWTTHPIAGYGLVVGLAAALLAGFSIWLTIALWNGRRMALWWVLSFNLPAAVFALSAADASPLRAILPGIAAIYCMLRLTGSLGPKPQY